MPYFDVTFRVTTAPKTVSVEAESREKAIQQALEQAPKNSETEVLQVVEALHEPEVEPPAARAAPAEAEHAESKHAETHRHHK